MTIEHAMGADVWCWNYLRPMRGTVVGVQTTPDGLPFYTVRHPGGEAFVYHPSRVWAGSVVSADCLASLSPHAGCA